MNHSLIRLLDDALLEITDYCKRCGARSSKYDAFLLVVCLVILGLYFTAILENVKCSMRVHM